MTFISGAMSGIKDYNRSEFNKIAWILRSMGHEVFNPAGVIIDESGLSEQEIHDAYMEIDLEGLEKCDTIFLLLGWENSRGSRQEVKRAIEKGMTIILQKKPGYL